MFNSTSEPDTAILLDLDITSVLVAVITLIIVGIVVVVTLIVIVWYLKQRRESEITRENNPRICANCEQASRFSLSHRSRAINCEHIVDQNTDVPVRTTRPPNMSRSIEPVPPVANTQNHVYSSNLSIQEHGSLRPTPPGNVSQRDTNVTDVLDYDLPPDVSISTSLVQSYASVCDDFLRRCTRDLDQDGPTEVTADNICEIRNLGQGQFGQVILAEVVGANRSRLFHHHKNSFLQRQSTEPLPLVAVKKLKPGADKGIQRAFEKEIRVMSQLKHENIVCLLGICTAGDMFLVMEYMENGDLSQYLKRKDWVPQGLPNNEAQILQESANYISLPTLVSMSFQIACGMKYLASLRFIHRDLASRNCLVGNNNIIKIADFGLSRSLYSSHYYKVKGCAILPLRWMATECFYGKFSEKSDVWAFGVTMWEIFSLCRQSPYEHFSNPELIRDAIKGPHRQLLYRHIRCPKDLYRDVIMPCWFFEPSERADFEQIYGVLKHYYKHC